MAKAQISPHTGARAHGSSPFPAAQMPRQCMIVEKTALSALPSGPMTLSVVTS